MNDQQPFAQWLKRQRKSLDLTREALGQRAHCSASAIRRLEVGDLRPSKALAESLATALGIPVEQHAQFVEFARGLVPDLAPLVPSKISRPLPPAPSPGISLPAPLTSFVGRERDVAMLCDLLLEEGVRLLTLTGPPGTGKTRLAIATATKLAGVAIFSAGVSFIPLASINDPTLAPTAIAQALGVHELPGKSPTDALKEHLRPQHLLLVLDNFEQIVTAAPLLADLLMAAPGVKMLVTSREALQIYGEHEFPVQPLELPNIRQLPTEKAHAYLGRYASVRLFWERARASRPDFRLSAENAAHVARICAWLDGLPLAIEMAAAQVKWMPVERLLDQLSDRLAVLTGGPRDLSPRQRSLEGAIDWSYNMLDDGERQLFRLLGVFAGGSDEEAIFDCQTQLTHQRHRRSNDLANMRYALRSLTAKSLLRQSFTPNGQARYEMLETIRAYALDKLLLGDELEHAHRAHAKYYRQLVLAAHPHLAAGGDQAIWLERLALEQGNLRAALGWTVAGQGNDAPLGLQLAVAMSPFWRIRNQWSEAYWWLQRALESASPAPAALRAQALLEAGKMLHYQWQLDQSGPLLRQGLALYQEANDQQGIAEALVWLGRHAFRQKNYPEAVQLNERSLALYQEIGNLHGISTALRNLGDCARLMEDYGRARLLYEQALTLSRKIENAQSVISVLNSLGELERIQGNFAKARETYAQEVPLLEKSGDRLSLAINFHNLGHTMLGLGDSGQAAAFFQKSLALYQQLADERGMALCLAGFAGVASITQKAEISVMLLSRARATLTAGRFPLPLGPADQVAFDRYLAMAQAQLAPSTFAAAWEAGGQMALNQGMAQTIVNAAAPLDFLEKV